MSPIPPNCTWVGGVSPDIDPEKLEEAIAYYDDLVGRRPLAFDDNLMNVVEAARAHLAMQPRFKEVDVWHVECVDHGVAKVHLRGTRDSADTCAKHASELGDQCVRVTGPHKHRMPA